MAASVPRQSQFDSQTLLTRAEVLQQAMQRKRALCIIDNIVYDFTDFYRSHPGGESVILEHAGRDASSAFESAWHSAAVRTRMGKYAVARIAPQDVVRLGSGR